MTPTPSAWCAVHPEQPALATCTRCGNFMCAQCNGAGAEANCPGCRAKLRGAFALDRSSLTVGALLEVTFAAWKREWLMLSLVVLVMMVASVALSVVGNVFGLMATLAPEGAPRVVATVVGQAVGLMISTAGTGVLQLGMIRICLEVLRGGRAELGQLASELPKFWRYLGQLIIAGLIVAAPMLLVAGAAGAAFVMAGLSPDALKGAEPNQLFELLGGPLLAGGVTFALVLVPLLWLALPLQLTAWELVYADCGAVEAVRRAYQLASGFRLTIFAVALLGMVAMIAGLLACCVGALPAVALITLWQGGVFLALRAGSGLPAAAR